MPVVDEDRLLAAVDLIGRTGATEYEGGYLHDDVPSEQAGWWATARYKGTKVTEENHPGPVEATEALAMRLMSGGKCQHCQGAVTLSRDGVMVYPGATSPIDGSVVWTEESARAARTCLWERRGRRWVRGCEQQPRQNPDRPGKMQRRAHKRRKR